MLLEEIVIFIRGFFFDAALFVSEAFVFKPIRMNAITMCSRF